MTPSELLSRGSVQTRSMPCLNRLTHREIHPTRGAPVIAEGTRRTAGRSHSIPEGVERTSPINFTERFPTRLLPPLGVAKPRKSPTAILSLSGSSQEHFLEHFSLRSRILESIMSLWSRPLERCRNSA